MESPPHSGIHLTAIIHASARIDPSAQVGAFAVVGEDVVLGPNVRIGPHALVEFADVGKDCQIHAGAFVGTAPQDLKYRGERARIVLGPGCTVRECVTLNRGTSATGQTKIGQGCLFMAYSHVAHDCVIGDEVVVANSVAIAGHVSVGDWAVIGGLAGLHQFIRVGKLAMIGAGSMVPLDIPPFAMAQGDRAKLVGLNFVGLKRRGYSAEAIAALKVSYREIFQSRRTFQEQVSHMSASNTSGAVGEFLAFFTESSRGITRPASRKATASGDEL